MTGQACNDRFNKPHWLTILTTAAKGVAEALEQAMVPDELRRGSRRSRRTVPTF